MVTPLEAGTFAAVVVAVGAIFLSIFLRPLKTEVKKIHSEHLNDLIHRWYAQIEEEITGAILSTHAKPASLRLGVEHEDLFNDLRNHVPADIKLFKNWTSLKNKFYELRKYKYDFLTHLTKLIETETKLKVDTRFQKPSCLATQFVFTIYTDMLCLVQGKNQYWVKENYKRGKFGPPFRLDIGSQAIAKGKKREVERAKHIHQAWLTSAPKSRYLKHAKILLDLETKLVDRRAKFILDLKNISAIPILPHSCKYIRWSLYGHIRSFLSAQRKG